jgi:hypothetical protein
MILIKNTDTNKAILNAIVRRYKNIRMDKKRHCFI